MGFLTLALLFGAVSTLVSADGWISRLVTGRDVDHPGNEDARLKDRDYSFLNVNSGSNTGSSNSGGGLWGDDNWPVKRGRTSKVGKQRDVDHPGNEKVQLKDRDYSFLNSGSSSQGSSSGGLWGDSNWKKRMLDVNKALKAVKQRGVDHPGNEQVQLQDRDYSFLNSGGQNTGSSNTGGGLWGDDWPLKRSVDHPGNEQVQLKDRDYSFLNSGGQNTGSSNTGGGLWADDWPLKKRALKTLRKIFSGRNVAASDEVDIGSRDYIDAVWGSNPWGGGSQGSSDPWGSNPWGTGTGGGLWDDDWPQ